MSQASSSSAASTPTNRTPNSKYTVTEDHEKKALMHGFLCEINDPKRRNARFTCQWCEKSPPRMFTVDCLKAYVRWNDMANHAKADHKKNRENTIVGSKKIEEDSTAYTYNQLDKSFLLSRVCNIRGSV